MIALIEGGWSGAVGAGMTASGGVGLAFTIITSKKPVYLGTADATLDLARMPKVRFAQDAPAISDALARFLRGFVARKGLVTGISLAQGARYMALYFGLMRWYAVARAAMAERDAVEEHDVHFAIRLVEKTLNHSPVLQDRGLRRTLNFLFNRFAPARSLYPSLYPS